MNIIGLICKLIDKLNLEQDEQEFALMQEQANSWYKAIRTDEEAYKLADKKEQIFIKIKRFSQEWYSKALFCVLYIIMYRWLFDMLYAKPKRNDDENDE